MAIAVPGDPLPVNANNALGEALPLGAWGELDRAAIDTADARIEEGKESEGPEPRGTRQPWRRPPGRERSSSPALQAPAARAASAWSPPSTLEQLVARDRSAAAGLLERLQYMMLDGAAEHEAIARLAENVDRSEATVRRHLAAQAWEAIERGQARPAELDWLATRAVRWEAEAERRRLGSSAPGGVPRMRVPAECSLNRLHRAIVKSSRRSRGKRSLWCWSWSKGSCERRRMPETPRLRH